MNTIVISLWLFVFFCVVYIVVEKYAPHFDIIVTNEEYTFLLFYNTQHGRDRKILFKINRK